MVAAARIDPVGSWHEAAQRQRAADDLVPGDLGQPEPGDPVQPRLLGPRLPILDRLGVRIDAVGVEAQLQRDLPAGGREIDHGSRGVVAAVVEDLPLDAGGVERDRLVGAEHQQPVAERLQLDRHLAELRPRRELQPGHAVAGEHPHQRGVARRLGATGRGASPFGDRRWPALEPVGDGQPDQRVSTVIVPGPVALAEREALALRGDGEVARRDAAEQVGEDRRRVRPGVAEPGDLGIRGEQRDGRPFASMECRSIGTACSPKSQCRRISSSKPSTRTASIGSSTR